MTGETIPFDDAGALTLFREAVAADLDADYRIEAIAFLVARIDALEAALGALVDSAGDPPPAALRRAATLLAARRFA